MSTHARTPLPLLLLAMPALAQSPWPLFPAQHLLSDSSEHHLALADVNGDGELDLVSSQGAPGVAVRLGNGLGVFSPVVSPGAALGFAKQVRTGDLEGDGDVDIVFLRTAGPGFQVLWNDGTGGFSAGPLVPGNGPSADLALAELDGSPGLDAAMSHKNGNLSLHFGDGAGGFSTSAVVAAGLPLDGLALGDLDADGDTDVTVMGGSKVLVYLGDGAGGLVPLPPVDDPASGIALGDLSGDGMLDLVLGTFSAYARVWLGDGQGGFVFVAQVPMPGGYAIGVATADLDLDGLEDFAVVSFLDESVSVVRSLGGGAFASATRYPAGYRARGIAVGMVDRDAGPDLLLGHDASAGPLLLQGDGSGTFRSALELAAGGGEPGGVFRGDFDADGVDDLAYVIAGTLTARLGDGAGGFSVPLHSAQIANCFDQESAKLNADAFDDVVVATRNANLFTGSARVLFGDGAGRFVAGPTFPASTAVYQIAVADVDADGDVDFAYPEGGALRVLRNDGTGGFVAAPGGSGIPALVEGLELARLNGDNLPDALVVSSGGVLRLDGLGAGAFAPPVPLANTPNAIACALADLDRDGDLDLATSHYQSGPMRLWTNDGAGQFTLLRTLEGSCERLQFADFDRDGEPELAGTVEILDLVRVWSGSASGPVEPSQGFRVGSQPFDLVALQTIAGTPGDLAVLGDSLLVLEGLAPAPASGLVYCTAKTNALGCVPGISASGAASAAAASGFVVRCDQVRNRKPGLLMYGLSGRASTPFSGGTLCLQPPIKRAGPLQSGGTPLPAQDCSGIYAIDMNTFAAGAGPSLPHPLLREPGVSVGCQFWGRDPGFPPPNATSLSDALEYTVAP